MQAKNKNTLKYSSGMDSFHVDETPSDMVSVINHENGTKGRCRVFYSFTDYDDFSFEHPKYSGVEVSFILGSTDNVHKVKEQLLGFNEIFSYQCRYLKCQRFVWAHGYTREKLDDFFRDFIHDHNVLLDWNPESEIPSGLER